MPDPRTPLGQIMSDPQRAVREAAVEFPPAVSSGWLGSVRRLIKAARLIQEREKSRLREEIMQVPGLMTLLMKPRNGQKWTPAERGELLGQLRRLSRISLYLTTLALPGTTLALPLIAWWLDRRKHKRPNPQAGKVS